MKKLLVALTMLMLISSFSFAQAEDTTEETSEKKIEFTPYFGLAVDADVYAPVNAAGQAEPGLKTGVDGDGNDIFADYMYADMFAWIGAGANLTDDVYFYFQGSLFPGFSIKSTGEADNPVEAAYGFTEAYFGVGVTYTANDYFSYTAGVEAAIGHFPGGMNAGFDIQQYFNISVAEGFFNMGISYWFEPMFTPGAAISDTDAVSFFNQIFYNFDFMFGQFIKEDPAYNFGLYMDGETKTFGYIEPNHSADNWLYTGLKYAPFDFFSCNFGFAQKYHTDDITGTTSTLQNGVSMGVNFTADWLSIGINYYPLWEADGDNNIDTHDFKIKLGISL